MAPPLLTRADSSGIKASLTINRTNKEGAFVCLDEYQIHSIPLTKHLKHYILQNYKSWVDHSIFDLGELYEGPVFIYRVVKTASCVQCVWMERGSSTSLTFEVTAVKGILSAGISASGTEHEASIPHLIHCPSLATPLEKRRPQNVFIKYAKVKSRFPRGKVVAGAGPHQLPRGDYDPALEGTTEVRQIKTLMGDQT